MRQASKRIPESAEKTVRDIRRATRRHHSAEEKIRIVLEGLRGEDAQIEPRRAVILDVAEVQRAFVAQLLHRLRCELHDPMTPVRTSRMTRLVTPRP